MEPTQFKRKVLLTANEFTNYSALVARAQLAARLGTQQYGGDRNIYQALGYKLVLTYEDFLARYRRQDIAKAVIDRPVNATWHGELEILESDNAEQTALEKAWKDLNKAMKLHSTFNRLDKLTCVGTYGVLLLGFNDVKQLEDFTQPVSTGRALKLLYVKPFGEGHAKIEKYINDPSNPRYGYPELYRLTVTNVENGSTVDLQVHYSRVMHVVYDNLESDIIGTPQLEPVFNRLMDLEKIVGGDAEMFWRGARPGYTANIDAEHRKSPTLETDLMDQLDEYEHNLRRILVNEGIDYKAMEVQVSDPKNHVDIQIQMICAEKGIPKRVLTGSERGELASSQDSDEWASYVQTRRENKAEPLIVRAFIDRMIELKLLPEPKDKYTVDWSDLFAMSEKEKAELGKTRSEALKNYAAEPMAETIISPDAFMELFLGLDSEQIELVKQMNEAVISTEVKQTQPTPPGQQQGQQGQQGQPQQAQQYKRRVRVYSRRKRELI